MVQWQPAQRDARRMSDLQPVQEIYLNLDTVNIDNDITKIGGKQPSV